MPEKCIAISFLLTFSKLFFLPLGILQIYFANKFLFITIFLLVILDILDGQALRCLKVPIDLKTKIKRQLIDTILDRLLMHSYVFMILFCYNLSYLYYFIFLVRELILAYIVSYNYIKFHFYIKPNWFSKSANIMLGIFVASISLNLNVHFFLFVIFSYVSIFSLIKYQRQPSFIC